MSKINAVLGVVGMGRCVSESCSILGQARGRPSKDERAYARGVILGGPSSSHGPNFNHEAALPNYW